MEGKASMDKSKMGTWKNIYKMGAWAAICAVMIGVAEISITFLPGGSPVPQSIPDWFQLFQENGFMGLRNMGLLNILLNCAAPFVFYALFAAHQNGKQKGNAGMALIVVYFGIALFFATNRAFSMLALSQQYALAVSAEQRAMLIAAAQALLAVGQSHTAGTFLAFFLIESAGVFISIVMLRGGVFSKQTAWSGILGFSLLLIFEFFTSFFIGLTTPAMLFSMMGGILTMFWYLSLARRLFQLARQESA
jgi:hypothetical protein